MLQDEVRTRSFCAALDAVCAGRVVMDLGCGSGVLSIFAARAGAQHVFAVDGSSVCISVAQRAAQASGVAEKITFLEGDVLNIAQQVDAHLVRLDAASGEGAAEEPQRCVEVLVSEWMGFALVHEGMFNAVAFARDRWLVQGGLVLPSACSLWAAPLAYPEVVDEATSFWLSKPYGIDFSGAACLAWQQAVARPLVEALPSSAWAVLCGAGVGAAVSDGSDNSEADATCSDGAVLLARPAVIWRLDCTAASGADAMSPGKLKLCFEGDVDGNAPFHGFVLWFDVVLLPEVMGPAAGFSTGPEAPPTHWAQVLLLLDGRPSACVETLEGPVFQRFGRGDRLEGSLRLDVRQGGSGEVDIQLEGQLLRTTAQGRVAWPFTKRFELAASAAV